MITVVMFEGGLPGTAGDAPALAWMSQARRAIVLDSVERLLKQPHVARLIVCTSDRPLGEGIAGVAREVAGRWKGGEEVDVVVEPTGDDFHFGRTLADLVHRYRLDHVVVMGGASAPLISGTDLEAIARRLGAGRPGVWANNVHSADVIAVTPASSVRNIDPPAHDNGLCRRLHEQAGLPLAGLPRTLGLNFDIDTPTDVLILGLHRGAGTRLRRFLGEGEGLERLRRARAVLFHPRRDAFIAGRISGRQWRFLDDRTRCRLRALSEERGMKALGLEERGEVVSLLAFWIESVGPERFFRDLDRCCSAAFIDTRPLFAHRGRRVSMADRFASDLLWAEAISDPDVRAFTAAARAAPFPVVLGGHNLVTGGLWALLEADDAAVALPALSG